MSLIWKRRIEVRTAGLAIVAPRILCSVSRDGGGSAHKCEVRIWNLAPGSEQQIREIGREIEVLAGYGDRASRVFKGSITAVERERKTGQAGKITLIEAGSETVAPRSRGGGSGGGLVRIEYTEPRSMREIAFDIARQIKPEVLLGPLDAVPDTLIPFGRADRADSVLDDLVARSPGLTWYVADGVLRFTRQARRDSDAGQVSVSPDTGLIGAPTITDDGVSLKMFLDPSLQLGTVVDLESEAISGRYKVAALKLSLDNWDGPFDAALDLTALS